MRIIQHLSAIAIITIIMGLIFSSIQQTYRSNANDPQMQIAYDLRDHLQKGKTLAFDDTVDLEKSLAVFKELYDNNGNPLQSTGFLNGKMPQLPKGVFENAKANGGNWITWQPQRDVRMAMGIARVNAAPIAYVAVGRSLREVDARVSKLTTMVVIAWVLCVCVVLANGLLTYYNYKKRLS